MKGKLIDSNILVYAFDVTNLKKRDIAKELIGELAEANEGILSVQNLVEFCSGLEKAKPAPSYTDISYYTLQFTKIFGIVNYTTETVFSALELASNYKIHFFDALIAATMEENSISEIITENEKDFSKIPWIKVINPFRK